MTRFCTRLRAILASITPLVLGVTCLWLLDRYGPSSSSSAPPVTPVARVAATRLVVFMVDSLDRSDVARPGAMPQLSARLRSGALHGPARACVDAITLPCVRAMITGVDRSSPLSATRNFGAGASVVEGSVLAELERRGHVVGYFGERMLGRALHGLTRTVSFARDDQTLRAALSALAETRLDLLFVHLKSVDEAAHKLTASSIAYHEELLRLDTQLAAATSQLRESDHFVILGDHGHAQSGRHIAGIGTHTYAAYFGPRFARPVYREMQITDHARIWAQLFGLRWGERGWVDDYFTGSHVAPGPQRPSGTRNARATPFTLLVLALAASIALSPALRLDPCALRRSRVTVCACALAAMFMLGFTYSTLAAWLEHAGLVATLVWALAVGCAGALLLRRQAGSLAQGNASSSALLRHLTSAVSAAIVFTLPPLEPFGGVRLPLLWFVLALFIAGVRALLAREHNPALLAGISALLAASLLPVSLVDYLPRSFTLYAGPVAMLGPLLPLALAGAAIARASSKGVLAALAGAAYAALFGHVSELWFLVPCVLALPLTLAALRYERLFPWACLVLPSAFWFFVQGDALLLAPTASVWLLWSLWPALRLRGNRLLEASTLLLLVWLSFWTSIGTRMGGVDFDFYFRWLPASADAASHVIPQSLLTCAKCLLVPAFGALLAQMQTAIPVATFARAERVACLRLAACAVFLVGLSLGPLRRDAALVGDATQELAFWVIALSVTGLVSLGARLRASTSDFDVAPSPLHRRSA